jgi:hypothetical protein
LRFWVLKVRPNCSFFDGFLELNICFKQAPHYVLISFKYSYFKKPWIYNEKINVKEEGNKMRNQNKKKVRNQKWERQQRLDLLLHRFLNKHESGFGSSEIAHWKIFSRSLMDPSFHIPLVPSPKVPMRMKGNCCCPYNFGDQEQKTIPLIWIYTSCLKYLDIFTFTAYVNICCSL